MTRHNTDPGGFCYYTSGVNPKILIHAGTHGDEYEVIGLVYKALLKHEDSLPPFVFVPEVSPSAVKQQTRRNDFGRDLNRDFFDTTEDEEVRQNIEIIKDGRFDLFVSFHEDPLSKEYYIYDVGYSKNENGLVKKHNKYLLDRGIGLLNGVDDPEDPFLGYEFVDGYRKFIHPEDYKDDGSVSAWVLNRNICREYLCPEIPGKEDIKTKGLIVSSFFEKVVTYWL